MGLGTGDVVWVWGLEIVEIRDLHGCGFGDGDGGVGVCVCVGGGVVQK